MQGGFGAGLMTEGRRFTSRRSVSFMIVRLLVSNNRANVKKVVLRSDTVIGRSNDCNLRIASREVSRKHCSILLSDEHVRVRDLGSSNGTYLNGEMIAANRDVPVPAGSELEIGNVRFVVHYDAPQEEEASTVEVSTAALRAKLAENQPPESEEVPHAPNVESADPHDETRRNTPEETRREASRKTEEPAAAESQSSPEPEAVNEDGSEVGAVDQRSEFLHEESAEDSAAEDDDTFSLTEAEVSEDSADEHADASQQPTGSAEPSDVEETISLSPDEIPASDPPRETPPATPSKNPSGWKSFFGLFGRKNKASNGTGTTQQQPKTETSNGTAAKESGDETVQLDPAEVHPPAAAEETISTSADESLSSGDSQHDSPQAPSDEDKQDDSNLQEFFRHLSQE